MLADIGLIFTEEVPEKISLLYFGKKTETNDYL